MKYILTFDVGTTSMKCCAFDEAFTLRFSTSTEYSLSTQGAHIVEADPALYWNTLCKSIQTLSEQGFEPRDVIACGITTQGETTIVLDRNGDPVCPAIVWLDDRAEKEAAFLSSRLSPAKFYQTTGLPEIGPALPLAKLKYLMDQPDIRRKADKVLLLEDYLVFRLTGQFRTEHSLICSTGYYDIIRRQYCEDLLSLSGANLSLLPEILPCGSIAGFVTAQAARACRLPEGTPVVMTAMDQVSSAIGAGNIDAGTVSETTGTCLTVIATTEKPVFSANNALQYYTHYDGKYLALAYNATAAIIQKWFKDEFIAPTDAFRASSLGAYEYMGQLAASVPPGCDGLVMLPHFAGKTIPTYHPDVRGCFYGLSLHTQKGHFTRAILEGVAYMLRADLDVLEDAGISIDRVYSLGGGSKSPLWCEIKAAVTRKTVVTTALEESTSLGAAILCMAAIDPQQDVPSLVKQAVRSKNHYLPDPALVSTYDTLYRRYQQLDQAISSLSEQMPL